MSAERSPAGPPRPTLRESAAILSLLACVAGVGVAFAWPWMPGGDAGSTALASYAPVDDGRSFLYAKHDSAGAVLSWESQNQQVLRIGRALAGDLRKPQRDALEKLFLREGETDVEDDEVMRRFRGSVLVRVASRELKPGGELGTTLSVVVRSARGEHLLALYDAANDRDLVFEPAVQTLPAELPVGRTWESKGTLAGMADYTYRGRVAEAGPFRGRAGSFSDCRRIESRFVLGSAGTTFSDERWNGWYCAGVGLVDEETRDAAGALTRRRVTVAAEGVASVAGLAPPPLPARGGAAPAPASGRWELTRLARMGQTVNATESTILPVWIPGAPDALLVAGQGSGLTAYDASDPTGTVLWRFHPGGTVYSPPAHDPRTGRIFFGASDKRLYALDARGLFLWSFRTGDNVATRPVVVGDVVVFGSEDRVVYGVEAATGKLRWRRITGGAVVSSPAAVGGTVVIGSDDGSVYALDAATGRERWVHATDDAVEAPVVAEGGIAYAASRDGTVRALEVAGGKARWTAQVGNVVRSAVALSPDAVYAVDTYGYVKAFDRRSGRRLWTTPQSGYAGPVVVADGRVHAARADGSVHRLAADGAKEEEWKAPAGAQGGRSAGFPLGAAAGGGALWLADASAGVWRLGAGTGGAAPLPLAWVLQASEKPFDLRLVTATAVEHGGKALLLDRKNHLYQLDPAAGTAVLRGRVAPSERSALVEPTVAGDFLLVAAGDTLYASRLPSGRAAWRFGGGGTSFHPAVVADGTVLWTTQHAGGQPGRMSGTLHALDLATGRLRWSAPLRGVGAVGGVVVRGGSVYLGAPAAALDLATGRRLWSAAPGGVPLGSPALSPRGDVLYTATLSADGSAGALSALDAADGRVRWRAEMGEEVLNFVERIWTSGDLLVVPALSGRVVALDAATGAERWSYAPEAPRLGGITVDAGRVYLALQSGQVVVLDAATGRPAARFSDLEVDLSSFSYMQRPVRVGSRLVVATGLAILGLEI